MSGSVEPATVVAVLRLHAEYGRRMDGGDAEGLSQLFTEDGVFSFEETDTTGWAALAEFARNSPVGIHVSGAPSVEAGPDGTVVTQSNFVFVSPEHRRITTGWYIDTLVPGPEGLLFARRRAELRGRMDL